MQSPAHPLAGYQCHLATTTRRPLSPNWQTSNHQHAFYELGVVTQGSCGWVLGESSPEQARTEVISAGQAILIPAGQWHYEKIFQRAVTIEWTGIDAPTAALQKITPCRALSLREWDTELLTCTRQIRTEMVRQPENHHERLSLLVADLLLLLHRVSSAAPARRHHLTRDDQLEAARLYLELHPDGTLNIREVARYHGYSISHFEVLFARRYGLSPKRYQQQRQLETVLASLREGERSPKELATRHGFSDAAYFCRWFRKQTGTTPSQWREEGSDSSLC